MQTIQGDGFTVTIIKSRRKTSALKIKDGVVSIHIPNRLPLTFAKEFVLKKTTWIKNKLEQQSHQKLAERHFVNDEELLFLGNTYRFRLIQSDSSPAIIKTAHHIEFHGRLNRVSKTTIRATLISWYKQQATLYLESRTALLARHIKLTPRSITVKTYKARWGSCGVHGDIQFNWKLLLMPISIIDYVITHELCHIKHHNHSAQFWLLVGHCLPTFKSARLWLKDNAYTINSL